MKQYKALLCSVILSLGMAMGAQASEPEHYVTYQENGYTAQKISHPDAGLKEADGIIEYQGENDRGQNYSWSAVGYGDEMYVGTNFGAMYQTLKIMAASSGMDMETYRAQMNVLFNGALYMGDEGESNTENRSVLVKMNTKTGKVDIVVPPSQVGGYRAAIQFRDKLYFCVADSTPYLLEVDPKTDETKVVCYSEKPQNASISTGIRGLAVVNDQLIASMIGQDGAYLVASSDPSKGQESFRVIATQEDLLDYPAYHYTDSIFGGSVWDMVEYNGKLYLTVVTGKNGDKQSFAMFGGEENQATGQWKFHLIVGDEKDGASYPYGLGADRSGAANLVVHDGYLYIGGYNDPMIALPDVLNMEFENIYKDLSSPVCLWRMDSREQIEMVAGDADEVFPEGPTGNMPAGFGEALNQYVWRMQSYDGKLYVGTFDIGSLAYPLMQFTNGDVLHMSKEEWESQIRYIYEFLKLYLENNQGKGRGEQDSVEEGLSEMIELMEEGTELVENDESRQARGGGQESREAFYRLLEKLLSCYEQIRDQLPENVTERLDTFLTREKVDNFRYFVETCAYLSKGTRGFDLYVSEDGVNFETITKNGFGDPYNHGLRVFAVTNSGLSIGTANPFYGTQIWTLKEDGKDTGSEDQPEELPEEPGQSGETDEKPDQPAAIPDSQQPAQQTGNQMGQQEKALEAPELKAASVGYQSVTLKWNKVPGAEGYLLYRKEAGKDWKLIAGEKKVLSAGTLRFQDKKLKAKKTYYYKICAYRTVNGTKECGSLSKQVKTTPTLKKTKLTAASKQKHQVTLKWKSVKGAKTYVIYRKENGKGTSWKRLTKKPLKANVRSYQDKTVKSGKKYTYKVTAVRGNIRKDSKKATVKVR